MMGKLIYLASPHSHPDADVRRLREMEVCRAAAQLISRGHLIFCPIAHGISLRAQGAGCGWEFWGKLDERILSSCDEFWILTLNGWMDSTGVRAEIDIARRLGLAVRYVVPVTLAISESITHMIR